MPCGVTLLMWIYMQQSSAKRVPPHHADSGHHSRARLSKQLLPFATGCPQVAAHWVPPPSDRTARASFDSALHWWHTTIRAPCIDLLMGGVLGEGAGWWAAGALSNRKQQRYASTLWTCRPGWCTMLQEACLKGWSVPADCTVCSASGLTCAVCSHRQLSTQVWSLHAPGCCTLQVPTRLWFPCCCCSQALWPGAQQGRARPRLRLPAQGAADPGQRVAGGQGLHGRGHPQRCRPAGGLPD